VKVVRGHDDTVARWVEQQMGGVFVMPHRALGVIDDGGVLRGGFVLAFHNPTTAEVTVYAPWALTPGVAKSFFAWVFGECGVWRMQVSVNANDKPLKRGLMKMGFKFECVAKDFYGPDASAVQYRMIASDCRWVKHGQPLQIAV